MIDSNLALAGKVTEIKITKECGKHSKMYFSVIPDDMCYISDMLSFAQIGTEVEADLDGTLLMCGKIRAVSGEMTYAGAAVTVTAVSDSIESDTDVISRVFQSPEKDYKSIIEKLGAKTYASIRDDKFASEKIEDAVVQYNETDFSFLNRLAREHNTKVFVLSNERGNNEIVIADDMGTTAKLDNEKIISVSMRTTEYNELLLLEYSDYIEIGTKVKLDSSEYVVVYTESIQKDGLDRFFMRLEKITNQKGKIEYPMSIMSLGKAKVSDNKDPDNLGRINVEFQEIEDPINDKKLWIPYINILTAGEGGVIFIPDNDETVEVIIQNGKCFAYGCVRETAISDDVSDTVKKSIKLFDRTLVCEDKQTAVQTENALIQITEDETTVKNHDCNIALTKDDITLGNDKNTIKITGDQIKITVNDKGTISVGQSSIVADVNGKTKAEMSGSSVKALVGESETELSSSKFTMKAPSGIEASTSKFDVK